MPRKKQEEITDQAIADITKTVKKNVTETVINDIKSEFNQDYKNGIKEEIKSEIIGDIKKDIAKEQKKLSRAKSFKIFRLYIYLIVVVIAFFYLIFRLYETDNLTVIDKSYTRKTTAVENTTTSPTTTTAVVKDAEYYIRTYGHLMDDVKISNLELVKNGVDLSSMSIADKLVYSYAYVDKSKIQIDGVIHSLKEEDLTSAYNKAFGTTDGYEQSSFVVNGLNYAYSSINNSYIAIGEESEDLFVSNIIVNGFEEDGAIVLETKAYVVKDGGIYNPNNMNYRMMTITDETDVNKIQNRLLSVTYKFIQSDNGYRLVSIARK